MSVRRARSLTSDELALWRRVVDTVRPLRPGGHPPLDRPVDPAARAAPPRLLSAPPDPVPAPRAPAATPSPPADRGPERRVRRGQVEIEAALDLHGMTQTQAQAALIAFLRRHQGERAAVVLVVTGKGGRRLACGEAAPGILRQRLPDWLADPSLRDLVGGFAKAHPRHGGAGAYYVFVKRARSV